MWQKSGKKVVKSGTSPLRKVWKSLSAIQDTMRSSKMLRNLLQERLSITRNFELDLTVLSFSMLKSVLVSIHGVREKQGRKAHGTKNVSEVAFGLIPSEESYECR